MGAEKIILLMHVIAGGTSLLSGIVPMIAAKGGKWHNLSGLIYFWAMFVTSISGIGLYYYTNNIFLLLIGFFTLYLILIGYRLTKLKDNPPTRYDRTLIYSGLLTGVLMCAYSVYSFVSGDNGIGTIVGIFGVILFLNAREDYQAVLSPSHQSKFGKHYWLFGHLGKMLGSYIAAITAFLANVQLFSPHILNWLLPTFIGVFGMVYVTRFYKKKYGIQ